LFFVLRCFETNGDPWLNEELIMWDSNINEIVIVEDKRGTKD